MDWNVGCSPLAFFPGGIGPMEMIIVALIAVLLFGNRLPDVMRSMGKGLSEFRRGMHSIESEIQGASSSPRPRKTYSDIDDRDEATAPKFEPPPAEPEAESGETPDES